MRQQDVSQALATTQDGGFTPQQIEIIRTQIAPDASNEQLALFLEVCRGTGLNPFMRQIYAVFRNAQENGRWVKRMTIQTGIDGYRLLAARTGQLGGIDDAVFDSEDAEHPHRATVTVYRFVRTYTVHERVAFTATARWSEYVQTTKDGEPTSMWRKMPYLMLAKCAEALALRKAFPAELSGIYTADEMSQAENDLPTPPTPPARQAPSIVETTSAQEPLDEEETIYYAAEDPDLEEDLRNARRAAEAEPEPEWQPLSDAKFIASLRDIRITSVADQEKFIEAAREHHPSVSQREACKLEYASRYNAQKKAKATGATRGRGPSALAATSDGPVPDSLESLETGARAS